MSYKITAIEGIGPAFAEKLAAAEISTTDDLLTRCATPAGRNSVAETTGLSTAVLLKWANRADLMRISGVGSQFSELLEMAGVDTVKELKMRKADNLAATMAEVNRQKKLARTSPSAAIVAGWIEQAKTMEPRISH